MAQNYGKTYPRPFPCGSLILGFDRRRAEIVGHRLDISTGTCDVHFLVDGKQAILRIFADMTVDRVWLRMINAADGSAIRSPFEGIRLLPDPEKNPGMLVALENNKLDMEARAALGLPPFEVLDTPIGSLSFRQVLPYQEPQRYNAEVGHPKDRAFCLSVRINGLLKDGTRVNWHDQTVGLPPLEKLIEPSQAFMTCLQLDEGLASQVSEHAPELPAPTVDEIEAQTASSRSIWTDYWNKSGIKLADAFLERIWYWNLYFLNCATRPGVNCPGLFANWSYRNIGSAWHGDYHMNYNAQQPFWGTFSSNHVEKHLPYVDLVDHLLPLSRKWANEYYGLRGAFFPHSAYPVDMTIMPYPVPIWGWEICETPWTVQSLWWHYLYTMDRDYLRDRAFEPIKAAVLFLVDYMTRSEAHGAGWGDDRFHIYPTVVPELYGLLPGFRKNYDCLVDLTLTKFVFNAYLQSCAIIDRVDSESDLMAQVRIILDHFPEYAMANSSRGTVFISVPDESPEVIYNVPNSLMTVFPGEEHGLHSAPEIAEIARNSYRNMRIEGGNELVFLNLQAARLGLLDLERFKRQISYCLLPNGTCADMVLQVHGRYSDTTDCRFMAPMGIWFENFALPVVVNECLLQSYTGMLQFFPNWPLDKDAEFHTLRAAGAFLVSAALVNSHVAWIEIHSEAGSPLKAILPWIGARCVRASGETIFRDDRISIETQPGEVLYFTPVT